MGEHLSPENLARYRDLAQKAKKETFEPGWPYDGSGDWTGCVDALLGGITGEFAGAMSPDVVLALLDALDQKEGALERASRMVASRKQGFLDSWGSVEMTVASDHPFAVAGLTEIHGVRINVANDVTFIDPTGESPDVKLSGSKMHFHPADEPGFGSKATGDFDDDDDGFRGDGDG